MISFAQVVAALAVGAMLPVTALLAVEVHRLRQRTRVCREPTVTQPPERGAEHNTDSVEAIARLAAARFDLLAQEPDADCTTEAGVGRRSKAHLTLVSHSPRPEKKRFPSVAASEARRPLGYRPDVAARTHRPVRRD